MINKIGRVSKETRGQYPNGIVDADLRTKPFQ